MIGCDNPNCPYEWFHYSEFYTTQNVRQVLANPSHFFSRLRRPQTSASRKRHVVLSKLCTQDAEQQYEAETEMSGDWDMPY
jgi:hypothetical protein